MKAWWAGMFMSSAFMVEEPPENSAINDVLFRHISMGQFVYHVSSFTYSYWPLSYITNQWQKKTFMSETMLSGIKRGCHYSRCHNVEIECFFLLSKKQGTQIVFQVQWHIKTWINVVMYPKIKITTFIYIYIHTYIHFTYSTCIHPTCKQRASTQKHQTCIEQIQCCKTTEATVAYPPP